MTKKEKIDLVLSKVAEDQKEAFIEAFRGAETKEERAEVLKKFDVSFSEEEIDTINTAEISDEELDEAAGGCCCYSSCEYMLCTIAR